VTHKGAYGEEEEEEKGRGEGGRRKWDGGGRESGKRTNTGC